MWRHSSKCKGKIIREILYNVDFVGKTLNKKDCLLDTVNEPWVVSDGQKFSF